MSKSNYFSKILIYIVALLFLITSITAIIFSQINQTGFEKLMGLIRENDSFYFQIDSIKSIKDIAFLIGILMFFISVLILKNSNKSAAIIKSYKNSVLSSVSKSYQSIVDNPKSIRVLLLSIFVLGFLIRFQELFRSPHHDEAKTITKYVIQDWYSVLTKVGVPNNQVLNTILMKISYSIFGFNIWAFRMPAFIFGLLTMPFSYILGSRFYGKKVGVILLALVVLSMPLINYSVNARGYSLMGFLTILLMLSSQKIINSNYSYRTLVFFSIVSSLGLLTSSPMLISISISVFYIVLSRKVNIKNVKEYLILCILILAITYLFYLPAIFYSMANGDKYGVSFFFNNEYVTTVGKLNSLTQFSDHLLHVFEYVGLGFPYYSIPFLFILFFFFKWNRQKKTYLLFYSTLFILSMFYALKQIEIPIRVYSILLPIIFLFSSISIKKIINFFESRKVLNQKKIVYLTLLSAFILIYLFNFNKKSRVSINIDQTLISAQDILIDLKDELIADNAVLQFSSPHSCILYYGEKFGKSSNLFWTPNKFSKVENFPVWGYDKVYIIVNTRNSLDRYGYLYSNKSSYNQPVLWKNYEDCDVYIINNKEFKDD